MKKKLQLITFVVTFVLMSNGCSKEESETNASKIVSESTSIEKVVETTTEYLKEYEVNITTEEIKNTMTEKITEIYIETTEELPSTYNLEVETNNYSPVEQEQTFATEDNSSYFEKENNQIKELYRSDYETFKTYSKAAFIKAVDFIFYGSEINGVTFNELTDDCKETVYYEFKEMVNLINAYNPDIIPNLEEKYSIIQDFLTSKYESAIEAIKNKVGEEKYEAFIDKKDEIASQAIDFANEKGAFVKKYANEKYQNFKNNNDE